MTWLLNQIEDQLSRCYERRPNALYGPPMNCTGSDDDVVMMLSLHQLYNDLRQFLQVVYLNSVSIGLFMTCVCNICHSSISVVFQRKVVASLLF